MLELFLIRLKELIKESEVRDLCNRAREILMEESNVQNINAPVTVYQILKNIQLKIVRFVGTFTVNFLI